MVGEAEQSYPLLRNRLKHRLARGELSLCLRTTLVTSNEIAFLADAAGFDALYVDLEHTTTAPADAARVCSTATALGITALVRITSVDDPAAVPLLDAGCQGIIAPHVESAEDARRLAARCLFPPQGRRSSGGPALQLGYQPVGAEELAVRLNRATLLCVMLESPRAVSAVGAIAAVDGIDLVLVGTQDLSSALGVPGAVDSPQVVEQYERVASACAAAGTAFGVAGVQSPDVIARYVALGARFVSAGSDADLLRRAATDRVAALRGAAGRP
jgi:2-keto-3-deoxy-L-rhamnonate aldolase RhmA